MYIQLNNTSDTTLTSSQAKVEIRLDDLFKKCHGVTIKSMTERQ